MNGYSLSWELLCARHDTLWRALSQSSPEQWYHLNLNNSCQGTMISSCLLIHVILTKCFISIWWFKSMCSASKLVNSNPSFITFLACDSDNCPSVWATLQRSTYRNKVKKVNKFSPTVSLTMSLSNTTQWFPFSPKERNPRSSLGPVGLSENWARPPYLPSLSHCFLCILD